MLTGNVALSADPEALTRRVKQSAKDLGFDLVGIARAEASRNQSYFRAWLDAGRAGEMHYLGRWFDERTQPQVYLPGALTVVCVAINYHVELEEVPEDQMRFEGRIARYALGSDYHEHIKQKLYALADWMRDTVPEARTRCAVDTAPVMEKEMAVRAGIGWQGKNTCIIHPSVGSWLLLGEVLTTIPLVVDEPETDHCGTCTRCLEACPTGAITAPYQLDATRCISYLTIEHRGPIEPALASRMGNWLYGCDVCQDVCPHNGRAPAATNVTFRPRFPTGTLDVREVLAWDDQAYHARLRGSAMRRIKLPVLQRNARIVESNLQVASGSAPATGEASS